ncbi:MAG: sugar phosphate isomerase/epimerase family protein [Terriglobia bacterium]
MNIALQSLVTMHCNLLTDIRIAAETGHSGIELNGTKLKRYLAQGYPIETLQPLLKEVPPVGLTYIQDIERQDPAQQPKLLDECESLCLLAEKLACPMIQLLTGPLDPTGPYKGPVNLSWPELRRLTARNLKSISRIGRAHGIKFFLEALTWTPLHQLSQVLEVIDEAGEDNIGLVVDFWHLWDSGSTSKDIAKLPKDLIYCVHFCDSLEEWGQRGTHEQRGRDVWTGGGKIPLKEWVEAVKSTGFDGCWSCELLSPKYWELDPWKTARDLKGFLEYLIL